MKNNEFLSERACVMTELGRYPENIRGKIITKLYELLAGNSEPHDIALAITQIIFNSTATLLSERIAEHIGKNALAIVRCICATDPPPVEKQKNSIHAKNGNQLTFEK